LWIDHVGYCNRTKSPFADWSKDNCNRQNKKSAPTDIKETQKLGVGCFSVDKKYTQSEIGDLIELGGEGLSSKCVGKGSRKGAKGKQGR
jgi:hypothetical protein